DETVRQALWKRWHYFMIDEYQDTNAVQLEMARILAGPRRNLCVVGDDDQSIYAWRGADLRNILDFERHFTGARTVVLDENYRSTQRILDAANAVIAHNAARKPKRMRTARGPGPKIDYWEFDRDAERTAEEKESEMVAREVGVRRFHERLRWRDFAVLYRANHQARPIEEALRKVNIPYRVIGGTSYFDRKEIADAAAYLRVLLNPRDDLALRRIINFPTRGIGRGTLLRLVEAARDDRAPIMQVLQHAARIEGINRAQAEAIESFSMFLEASRRRLREAEDAAGRGLGGNHLGSWATRYFRDVQLEEALRQEAKGERLGEIRVDNLRDFVASLERYERRTWAEAPRPDEEIDWSPPTIAGFLEGVSLFSDADDVERDDSADQVTLMTLHSAKGLEFVHVFIVGLEEEILPHVRSVNEIAAGDAPDPIAEERRLFYVGITRARHRLTLSGCRTRRRGADWIVNQPSRFLREIPAELLDVRTAGAESSLSEADRKELKQNFFAQMKETLG
ncbi:MAG TPA: 3'-5' exonuclease, partial [Longimicrobiaceae bacterium]|nr:3'-5' exonuclease [Longimicrobiaceae bacterium]